MAVSADAQSRSRFSKDRLVGLFVPVALAVFTWLAALLALGFIARLNSLSLLNVLPVFFVVLLFWPVYRAAPWRPGLAGRVYRWARDQRLEAAAVIGLGLLPVVPFVPDVLVSLLQLPYRGSGIFFGAALFYRERFGPLAGRILLTFGQTYLQLLWLFFMAKGVVFVVRRLR